jgi:hypothetical protein
MRGGLLRAMREGVAAAKRRAKSSGKRSVNCWVEFIAKS